MLGNKWGKMEENKTFYMLCIFVVRYLKSGKERIERVFEGLVGSYGDSSLQGYGLIN